MCDLSNTSLNVTPKKHPADTSCYPEMDSAAESLRQASRELEVGKAETLW